MELRKCIQSKGSFRDVHLTDPPCKRLSASFYVELDTSPPACPKVDSWVQISDPAGITMGKLAAALMEDVHDIGDWDSETRDYYSSKPTMAHVVAENMESNKKGSIVSAAVATLMLEDVVIPME